MNVHDALATLRSAITATQFYQSIAAVQKAAFGCHREPPAPPIVTSPKKIVAEKIIERSPREQARAERAKRNALLLELQSETMLAGREP